MKSVASAKVRSGVAVTEAEPVPDGDRLANELRALSGLMAHKDLAEAKRDRRTWSASYSMGTAPSAIREIIKFTKERLYDLNPTGLVVHCAASMRQGNVTLPQPSPSTMYRFLLSFGEKESYYLDPDVPVVNTALKDAISEYVSHRATRKALLGPSGLNPRTVVMEAGTSIALGPCLMSDYLIHAGKGGNQGGSGRRSAPLRPARFHCVTVVVDYHGTEEQVRWVTEKMRASVKVVGAGLQQASTILEEAQKNVQQVAASREKVDDEGPAVATVEEEAEMDDLLDQI